MPRTKGAKNKIKKPKQEKVCYSYVYASKFIAEIVQGVAEQSNYTLSKLLEQLITESTTTKQVGDDTFEHTLTLRGREVAKVVNNMSTAPKVAWQGRRTHKVPVGYLRKDYKAEQEVSE
jgi:hypothetical protein